MRTNTQKRDERGAYIVNDVTLATKKTVVKNPGFLVAVAVEVKKQQFDITYDVNSEDVVQHYDCSKGTIGERKAMYGKLARLVDMDSPTEDTLRDMMALPEYVTKLVKELEALPAKMQRGVVVQLKGYSVKDKTRVVTSTLFFKERAIVVDYDAYTAWLKAFAKAKKSDGMLVQELHDLKTGYAVSVDYNHTEPGRVVDGSTGVDLVIMPLVNPNINL